MRYMLHTDDKKRQTLKHTRLLRLNDLEGVSIALWSSISVSGGKLFGHVPELSLFHSVNGVRVDTTALLAFL